MQWIFSQKIFKKILFLIFLFNINLYANTKIDTKNNLDDINVELKSLKQQVSVLQERIKKLEKIKWIKETIKKRKIKIGVALSGGGAKGIAHIGVLKMLDKYGIHPDYITGTSMGAIVASLYSVGYTPNEIENIIVKQNWDRFIENGFAFPNTPLEKKVNSKKYMLSVRFDDKFNFSLPQGISSTEGIYFVLKKYFARVRGITDFSKLPISLRVIATNLNTGHSKTFSSGDLAKCVCASLAVPTIFEPVNIDGVPYVDGMVARNFPVQDAYKMGADVVIGSDVGVYLHEQKDYDIVKILNQVLAIYSNKTNKAQQELTTILITPDVRDASTSNLSQAEEFIKKGEIATQKYEKQLKILAKYESRDKIVLKKLDPNITIRNIKFTKRLSPKNERIIKNILSNVVDHNLTYAQIENSVQKLYGTEFIKSVYYDILGDTLNLNITINPANSVGVGVEYLTGYGTVFNVGTSYSNVGKIGNTSLLNIKLGDYVGASLDNFIYYGHSDKIGLFANFSYEETPLFIYDGTHKVSDILTRTSLFEIGGLTQYNNSFIVSYGIDMRYVKTRLKTGQLWQKINRDKSYNGAFVKFEYDNTEFTNSHPDSGVKGTFRYDFENSLTRKNSNFYGPKYLINGYFQPFGNITFNYGLSGGFLNKKSDSKERYFKIGGMRGDFSQNQFAFYGLPISQKLVNKFFIFKLGANYEFYPNTYVGGLYNVGKIYKKNKMGLTQKGLGLTLSYYSPIGPLELAITHNKQNGFLTQVSIGYVFE